MCARAVSSLLLFVALLRPAVLVTVLARWNSLVLLVCDPEQDESADGGDDGEDDIIVPSFSITGYI